MKHMINEVNLNLIIILLNRICVEFMLVVYIKKSAKDFELQNIGTF